MFNRLITFALTVVTCVAASGVDWYSSTAGSCWQRIKAPKWSATATAPTVTVATDRAQVIDGLGGTFNELGWDALCSLDQAQRDEVMRQLFSPDESNYTYCRLPIGASDFAMNFYSLNDVPGDLDMVNFSIARDRHILIRYIKAAQRHQPALKFWASPWSPPAWMKTNEHYASSYDSDVPSHNGMPRQLEQELPCTGFKMQHGYLQAYALYFEKYVKAYAEQGVPISAICIQNEPCSTQKYASCTWRPEDMAYFVGNFLGPAFEAHGIDTDIYFGTINRDNPAFTRTALDDPKARKYFKGVGFQWDGKGAIPYISKEYPHLKMMHTEAECGNGCNDWAAAEHTWWQMSHYLRHGASMFTYWNMILDQTATSPWGWRQNSLITVDTERKTVAYHPEFYLMKHLCHSVQPGAHRLLTPPDNGQVLAFENPDGKVVVVLVNITDQPMPLALEHKGRYLNVELCPHSFNTITF
ncbi:MAG: glycoside hydrolase family 30 protein [Muribaculaceae bacterium]|nr:glycoside hydrolase family 30 protein [Muribaculaceae bacterium]